MNISTKELIESGVFGVIVGDALGVPVEFTSRAERKADPVIGAKPFSHKNPMISEMAKVDAQKEAIKEEDQVLSLWQMAKW